MPKILLTDKISNKIPKEFLSGRVISTRKLSRSEICFVRKHKIKRYYLPSLEVEEGRKFIKEFDAFWNELISGFDVQHPFWRNVVSSKMQEWEESISYFAVILFSLNQIVNKNETVILIVGTVSEWGICQEWAQRFHWDIRPMARKGRFLVQTIFLECKNVLYFFRIVFKTIIRKLRSPKFNVLKVNTRYKNNVLIVSLFYPWSIKGRKYSDPFFGNIHERLDQNDVNCMYLCDYLVEPDKQIVRSLDQQDQVVINLPYSLLSWWELAKLLINGFAPQINVRRAEFMRCDFSQSIRWHLRRCSYSFSVHAQIFYEAVSKLSRKISFQELIYIHEGNVLERACIQGYRLFSEGRVTGYCHGVVFPSNLKLRLSESEKKVRPNPDRIICTGDYSKKKLLEMGDYKDSSVLPGCSLRYIPNLGNGKRAKQVGNIILVALDGVYSTVAVLDWLIEHADVLKSYQVRVRAHPNVPMTLIKKYMFYSIPQNFILSENSLEKDFEDCFCVLYRHASIGIQAILNGIEAVHLAVDSPLSGDPISEVTQGKRCVKTSDDLKNAIEEIERSLVRDDRAEMAEENKDVAAYFSFPTNEKMKEFILKN